MLLSTLDFFVLDSEVWRLERRQTTLDALTFGSLRAVDFVDYGSF
jgi:hypothetical protein